MVSHSDRLAFANQYIDAAREIGLQTRDQEARCYWNHLLAHGVIVAPESSSGENFEISLLSDLSETARFDRRSMLLILAVFPEDLLVHESFEEMWDAPSRAMYHTHKNVIYLKNRDSETEFLMGCSILHEAGHSFRAIKEGRIGELGTEKATPHELLEESDLHYLEGRLWKERGGSVYLDILDKAVCCLQPSGGNPLACLGLKYNEEYLLVLDTLFGPMPNEKVRWQRMWSFALQVNFEAVDRSSVKDKRQARANIIDEAYKNANTVRLTGP